MEREQNKMKRLILSTVIGALLIGCSSTQPTWNKEQTCETAKLAYTVYKEVLAAGGTPSKEEIMAARSASAFLAVYCGWVDPNQVQSGTPVSKKINKADVSKTDGYGVLILVEP